MKVLLISANTETINMPVLPLGLACVDAALQASGFETKSLNLMEKPDTLSLLENTIKNFHPDAIAISVRNIDDQNMNNTRFLLDPVKEIITGCRKLCDAPIILGGAGYSIFPDAALQYLGADMGIKGEGEVVLPELLRRIHRHAETADIPGLYLPHHPLGHPRERIRYLSKILLPRPGIHLYVPDSLKKQEIWLPFQTRRGCPMDCSYCSTGAIEGRIIRKFAPEQVLRSIAEYVNAGFKNFFFVDNTFNLPPAYAEALCDGLISANLNIKWRCIIYPSNLDERLVSKLARAGCVEVSFGFESGSDKILRLMNKRYDTHDIGNSSKMLADYNIHRMGFLLLGGPGETRETVLESLALADVLKLDSMKITVGIRIYPHTRLADIARTEKIIKPDDDLLLPKFYIGNDPDANWIKGAVSARIKDHSNWFMQ